MITLIDNYDSFTWNLYHFLGELGAETVVHRNDQVSVGQVLSSGTNGIVLSPGPCTPDDAGICLELVEAAQKKLPLFGVCLGHQSLGQVFGAKVVRAPDLMHGKVSTVEHYGHGLFEGIPEKFQATRYHSLTLEPDSLPDCLEVTARSDDGVIMGISHRELPLHGVQFHPESIASEYGHKLLGNFLKLTGLDPKDVPGNGAGN
ncbi:Para-aminobenzoate synthase, amidotransferase component [hydrothermal vent metagenome]|uniref:Para-aminobenzoate synthase, amidotransferase component n=1 Tax=hydrothermal vent metagenome TaxID=652676 RepID=A0A3B0RN32_9ZZZZ